MSQRRRAVALRGGCPPFPQRIALPVLVFVALGLSVGACSAQAGAETGGTKALTDKLGITTTPPEPQDFVRKSRPAELDYRPVGVVPPARSIKPRTPEQLKAMEADLAATSRRHDAVSGRPPAASTKAGAGAKLPRKAPGKAPAKPK